MNFWSTCCVVPVKTQERTALFTFIHVGKGPIFVDQSTRYNQFTTYMYVLTVQVKKYIYFSICKLQIKTSKTEKTL